MYDLYGYSLVHGVQCPAAPKQVAFSHVAASSTTSIGTHGGLQGGTDEITNDKGLKGSASADGILENVTDPLLKKKKKEYKEPWVIIALSISFCCCSFICLSAHASHQVVTY